MAEAHIQPLPKSFQGLRHYSLPRQSTHDFVLLNYSAKPLHSKVSCSQCCISHNNFSESRETWWNIRKKECTRKLCDSSPLHAVSLKKRKWNLRPGKNCESLATDLTAASTWAAAVSSSEWRVQKLLIHEEKEIRVGLTVSHQLSLQGHLLWAVLINLNTHWALTLGAPHLRSTQLAGTSLCRREPKLLPALHFFTHWGGLLQTVETREILGGNGSRRK